MLQEDAAPDSDSDSATASPPAVVKEATPSKSQRRKQKLRAKKAEADARAQADAELDALLAQHAHNTPTNGATDEPASVRLVALYIRKFHGSTNNSTQPIARVLQAMT